MIGLMIAMAILFAGGVIVAPGRHLVYVLAALSVLIASTEFMLPYLAGGSGRIGSLAPHIVFALIIFGGMTFRLMFETLRDARYLQLPLWALLYLAVVFMAILSMAANNYYGFAAREFVFILYPFFAFLLVRSQRSRGVPLPSMFLVAEFTCWLIVGLSLVSLLLGRPIFSTDYRAIGRFMGPMGWSGISYLTIPILAAGIGQCFAKGISFRTAMVVGLSGAALMFGLSRTAYLATGVALAVMFLCWRALGVRKLTWGAVSLAILGVCAAIILPVMLARTFDASGQVLTSGRGRAFEYLSDVMNMHGAQFAYGTGFGRAREATEELSRFGAEVRSRYLVFYYDVGIVGLALYIACVAALIHATVSAARRIRPEQIHTTSNANALTAVGCAIAFGAIGLFDNLALLSIVSFYFIAFAYSSDGPRVARSGDLRVPLGGNRHLREAALE